MTDPRYIELESLLSEQAQRRLKNTPYLIWLAQRCATLATGSSYIVRLRSGSWIEVGGKERAAERLKDQWGMVPDDEYQIGDEEISRFLSYKRPKDDRTPPYVPTVSGVLIAPGVTASAVRYGGCDYINAWRDTALQGDPEAMRDPTVREHVTVLLRMLREGLAAAEGVLGYEEMLGRLHSRDPNEVPFRFILNWWAAILQQPGINLMTNLCHLGTLEGTGKGTSQEIMRRIIGGNYVITASTEEFGRNWTDQMIDKRVICLNEVGDERPRINWEHFIKRYCNETEINPSKRFVGIGAGPRPNHCNWSFTSNNETPFRVSDSDRRSALFPTTDNTCKLTLAKQTAELLAHGDPALVNQVLQGLAYILRSLAVEHDLIARPVENDLRHQNKMASQPEALFWLESDNGYIRDVAQQPKYWAGQFSAAQPGQAPVSAKAMGAMMWQMQKYGVVAVPRKHGARTNYLYLVPSNAFPVEPHPADLERKEKMRNARQPVRLISGPVSETPTRH